MTSSYRLKKRLENRQDYLVDSPWSHYIEASGSKPCHPEYIAQSFGHPDGVKICHRKYREATKNDMYYGGPTPARGPNGEETFITLADAPDPIATDPSQWNGYNKFSADLYRPWRDTQIQMYNPVGYADRRPPHETYLTQKNYYRPQIRYDGTGTKLLHTPPGTLPYDPTSVQRNDPKGGKFITYSYGHMKNDPPAKFDVTRLTQQYPIWKSEQAYLGNKLPKNFEKNYNDRIV
jgi:hypothetical protein